MSGKLLIMLAAGAAVAMPAMVVAQGERGARSTRQVQPRRTCEVYSDIRSRLSGARRCMSASERESAKQESRQVVERIQTMKASTGR